jgi:hypothetical protein
MHLPRFVAAGPIRAGASITTGDSHVIDDAVAGMHDDSIAFLEAASDLGDQTVAVAELDDSQSRVAVILHEQGPLLALSE